MKFVRLARVVDWGASVQGAATQCVPIKNTGSEELELGYLGSGISNHANSCQESNQKSLNLGAKVRILGRS